MKPLLRPSNKKQLEKLFPDRPHPLLGQLRYFLFTLDNKPVGYVGLGYGLQQKNILNKLFSIELNIEDYYEIVRSYARHKHKNAPSQMLGIMLKMLKKHTNKKFIYTTGAGFQGLTGRIYQASNFKYIGKFNTTIYYLPKMGYIHSRSFTNRYIHVSNKELRKTFPNIKKRHAPIYRYLYFLKNESELMKFAKFKVLPYPKREEMEIWEEDLFGGNKKKINYKDAYSHILSLKVKSNNFEKFYNCAGSVVGDTPADQVGEGGSIPTPALSFTEQTNA